MPCLASAGGNSSRQQAYCSAHHPPHALVIACKRLRRRQPVHAALDHAAFDLLLQAGDAHLEKLVEIGTDDAEELQPFQQGIGRVERLVQDALIEFQPAQLAIDEMFRLETAHNKLFPWTGLANDKFEPSIGKVTMR